MIAPRRLRLHQIVARALERHYETRLDEHAVELAEHFAQSTDKADLAKAVAYGKMAAARATAVFAYGEAAGHLERCLSVQEVLDPADSTVHADILLRLAHAFFTLGDFDRLDQVAEDAYGRAMTAGMGTQAAEAGVLALRGIMRAHSLSGVTSERGVAWIERVLRIGAAPSVHRAFAQALQSILEVNATGAVHLDLLLESYRQMQLVGEPVLLEYLRGFVLNAVEGAEAMALVEEMETTTSLPSASLTSSYVQLGAACLREGDRDRADRFFRGILQILPSGGDASVLGDHCSARIILNCLDGELEAAASLALSAEAQKNFGFIRNLSWRLFSWLGRSEEFFQHFVEASPVQVAPVPRLGAEFSAGRIEQTRAIIGPWRGPFRARISDGWAMSHPGRSGEVVVLEAAILLDEREIVDTMVHGIDASPRTRTPGLLGPTVIDRHLGDGYAYLGETSLACERYESALATAVAMRFRPEIALTRLALAALLLEHYPDERVAAIEHLDFAIAEFQVMKMQPALERALGRRGLLKA
jgi:hypothetical protein